MTSLNASDKSQALLLLCLGRLSLNEPSHNNKRAHQSALGLECLAGSPISLPFTVKEGRKDVTIKDFLTKAGLVSKMKMKFSKNWAHLPPPPRLRPSWL